MIDYALLLLRLTIGFFFFASGFRKTFNKDVHAHVQAFFTKLGVGNPKFVWLISIAEMLGGLAIILGFLTHLAAIGLIIILLGAIKLTCWPKVCDSKPSSPLQWWTALCMQPEILMVAILTTLTLTGAGTFSIDFIIEILLFVTGQN